MEDNFSSIVQNNKTAANEIKTFENTAITATPRNLAFGAGIIGTGVVGVMFAGQIITGMAALAVTGVVVVGGIAVAKAIKTYDPLIRQKMKNDVLKRMITEASTNSIFQLDNSVIDKENAIKRAKIKRDEVGGQVKSLKDNLKTVKETDPKTYEELSGVYDSVHNAYKMLVTNIQLSEKSVEEFKSQVNTHKIKFKFTQSAKSILSAINSEDSLGEMLDLAAFESINDNFNTSMTAIENLDI